MPDTGPEAQVVLQEYIDQHPFLSWLTMQVTDLDSGRVELQIPYAEQLLNPWIHEESAGRAVHGGVVATLIDTAGGIAVRSTLTDPVSAGVATIDLNVSYLQPATGDLSAVGRVVRVEETIGVSTVTITSATTDQNDAEVAIGHGSYRVFGGPDD